MRDDRVLRVMDTLFGVVFGVAVGVALLAVVLILTGVIHDYDDYDYPAVVRCLEMAEDTAAHVRLVEYDGPDEPIVYVCETEGDW